MLRTDGILKSRKMSPRRRCLSEGSSRLGVGEVSLVIFFFVCTLETVHVHD